MPFFTPLSNHERWSTEKNDLSLVSVNKHLNPVLKCWLFCFGTCNWLLSLTKEIWVILTAFDCNIV